MINPQIIAYDLYGAASAGEFLAGATHGCTFAASRLSSEYYRDGLRCPNSITKQRRFNS
jgi:hypothetical protein